MQGNRFTVSVHIHGTLAANAQGQFQLPCPASLEAVSMCSSANDNKTLDLGTAADTDGILSAVTGGVSGTPVLFTPATFDGELVTPGVTPHFDKDTVIKWALDFDGAAGTAAANFEMVLYFLEG